MLPVWVNRVVKHFWPEPVLDGVSFDVRAKELGQDAGTISISEEIR